MIFAGRHWEEECTASQAVDWGGAGAQSQQYNNKLWHKTPTYLFPPDNSPLTTWSVDILLLESVVNARAALGCGSVGERVGWTGGQVIIVGSHCDCVAV